MIRALIFDFDGVIADSEPVHLLAFQRTLAGQGVELTPQRYYESYLGLDDRGVVAAALRAAGRRADEALVSDLFQQKSRLYFELLDRQLRILPGVQTFVRQAARQRPLAICSGALRHEVEYILQRAGIRDCFALIVTAEDVRNCKPDPEGYLLTLARLNAALSPRPPLQPAEIVVVEDSHPGIQAARAAGMRVLALTTSHPRAELGQADVVVDTLEQVDPDQLESLLAN